MPNFNYKAFLGFIEYIYTDNIQTLKNNQSEDFEIAQILDLLLLAHEFRMDRLRKLCEESIEPSITIDNCTVIMKKAYEIGDEAEQLKNISLNYILLNY